MKNTCESSVDGRFGGGYDVLVRGLLCTFGFGVMEYLAFL